MCTCPQSTYADTCRTYIVCIPGTAAGVVIPTERAQGAINALTFTFRAAVHASVEAEELTTELKSFGASVWTTKAVKVLASFFFPPLSIFFACVRRHICVLRSFFL